MPDDAHPAEMPPLAARPGASGTARVVVRVGLFILLGLAIWLRFTESGQQWWAAIAQSVREWIGPRGPSDLEIGARLQNRGVRVIYDGQGMEKRITALDFEDHTLASADVADLPRLESLCTVNLTRCKVDDEVLQTIGRVPHLTSVVLSATNVTDEHLRHLVGLSELTALYLAATSVSDIAMPRVAEMTELRILSLDGTRVTDAGMKTLAALPKLEYLHLAETAISDAGLENLSGAPKLKKLVLTKTTTTRAGRQRAKQSLSGAEIVY